MTQETNEYRAQRLQSMSALREMGYEPYGAKYDHEDLAAVRATFEEGRSVRVAGRLLMIRRCEGDARGAGACFRESLGKWPEHVNTWIELDLLGCRV